MAESKLIPSYIPETRIDGKYPNEMTQDEHKELVENIISSKATIILSGYGHLIYDKLLKNKWHKLSKEVTVTCSHSNENKKAVHTECLYTNRELIAA